VKMPPKKARAEEELLLLVVKLHSGVGLVDWVGGVVVLALFSFGAKGVVVVEVVEDVGKVVFLMFDVVVVASACSEGEAVMFVASFGGVALVCSGGVVVGGIEEALEELETVKFASLGGTMVGAGREEVGEEVGVAEEVFEVEEEVGVAEEAFVVVALVVESSLFAVERKRRARTTA